MTFSNYSSADNARTGSVDFVAVMRQVYLWLTVGLVVCFGIAFAIYSSVRSVLERAIVTENPELVRNLPIFNPAFMIGGLVLYIGVSFAIGPVISRANIRVATLFYLFFVGLFGVVTSIVMIPYTFTTILAALGATAGMFGAMSIYGYVTKADLSRLGSILMMALIGLVIASLVNLLLRSEAISWIITYASVLIFAGMTAYDTQKIKNNAMQVSAANADATTIQRLALMGAVELFVDFINLFFALLRILGASRD
jgi:uncharacterized protein